LRVEQHRLAGNDDRLDADGVAVRIQVRRGVDDRGGIKYRDVRDHAWLDSPAIREPQPSSRGARDLVDRLLQAEHAPVADVAAEDAREGAKETWMRPAPRRPAAQRDCVAV